MLFTLIIASCGGGGGDGGGGDSDAAPTIALLGSETVTISYGDTYTDPGATATDSEDGDITANIVVRGQYGQYRSPRNLYNHL